MEKEFYRIKEYYKLLYLKSKKIAKMKRTTKEQEKVVLDKLVNELVNTAIFNQEEVNNENKEKIEELMKFINEWTTEFDSEYYNQNKRFILSIYYIKLKQFFKFI